MTRQWPNDYFALFGILSDDERTNSILGIKSTKSKVSTGRKLVDEFVKEVDEFVGADDISDDFDTEDYMEEKIGKDRTNLLLGIGKSLVERNETLETIEDNIVRLVQEIKGRKGRSSLESLISDILEEKGDVKANLVKFQTLIPNLNTQQMKTLRKRILNEETSSKLIKIFKKNQDEITEKEFYDENKINIDQSLLKISVLANKLDNKKLGSLKRKAQQSKFKSKTENNRITFIKLFPTQALKNKAIRESQIKQTFSVLYGKLGADIQIVIDHSDIRNLLIEKDEVLRDISSTEEILEEKGSTLVAEENIDEDRLEDYIRLLKKGLIKPAATKAITDFKLNNSSLYEKVFDGNAASKNHKVSMYLSKVLTGSADSPFDEAMNNNAKETILPEIVFREYVSQRDNWKTKYQSGLTPNEMGTDTEGGKNYFREYENLVGSGDAGIISKYFADYLTSINQLSQKGLEAINPEEEKDSKKKFIVRGSKFDFINDKLGSRAFLRRYKRYLEEKGLSDDWLNKMNRFKIDVNVEGVDLEKEPQAVAAIYSVLMREKSLLAFLGSKNQLKDRFKAFNIDNALRVYYHIISLMTNVNLKSDVVKIDSLKAKGSLENNPSLLTSVRSLADKINKGLKQFKQSFIKELKQRLKDIEEKPQNYLVIHKNDDIKKLLVRYNLMDKKVEE